MEIEHLIERLDNMDFDITDEAYEEILGRGKQAVPVLMKYIDSDDLGIRLNVIKLLGELKAGEAFDKIHGKIGDEDDIVRSEALHALCSIDSKRALPLVIEALEEDEDDWVREKSADLLGFCPGSREAARALGRALEDRDIYVRLTAAGSLGKLGSAEGYHIALKVLEDEEEDEEIRDRAARALGDIGEVSALPSLEDYHMEACIIEQAIRKLKKV